MSTLSDYTPHLICRDNAELREAYEGAARHAPDNFATALSIYWMAEGEFLWLLADAAIQQARWAEAAA